MNFKCAAFFYSASIGAIVLLTNFCAASAHAADAFPLTKAAWERLQALRKDERFYTFCFAKLGPSGNLAESISAAHLSEGQKLVMSDCGGDATLAPEYIHQLGMMYCKKEILKPFYEKIEAGLNRCFLSKRR